MLEQEYKTFYDFASIYIPNWKTANKNDLANAYIDNENNESLRNAYFSALMLRYWGNIGRYYISSKSSGFTIDECYSWLIEAITYALKMRKWRDPKNPLSKDKNAPDKVINRCIYSRRQYYYYLSNLDKRKSNFNSFSLDSVSNDNEIDESHNYLLSDLNYSFSNKGCDINTISCNMLHQNRWFESFMLNLLYLKDMGRYSTKKKVWGFNLTEIYREISSINYEEFDYILRSIDNNIEATSINSKYKDLKSLKETSLKSLISKTLNNLKNNEDLKSLCY